MKIPAGKQLCLDITTSQGWRLIDLPPGQEADPMRLADLIPDEEEPRSRYMSSIKYPHIRYKVDRKQPTIHVYVYDTSKDIEYVFIPDTVKPKYGKEVSRFSDSVPWHEIKEKECDVSHAVLYVMKGILFPSKKEKQLKLNLK